jgi:phage-related protein
MRANIETIDGKDGDEITKLGFSAYDKEIEIGLANNYDVDQVISYFNSEGQAVFSNEIDKYYNYTILEQIDFEKLLRFKKAKVKFHVQPFKYSNIEKAINFDNSEQVLTDNLLTINYPNNSNAGIDYTLVDEKTFILNGTATFGHQIPLETGNQTWEVGQYEISFKLLDGSYNQIGNGPFGFLFYLADSVQELSSNFNSSGSVVINISEEITASPYLWIGFSEQAFAEFNNAKFEINVKRVETTYAVNTIKVRNYGNYFSKPIITLSGSGIINLSLNNYQMFSIDFGDMANTITLDIENMNAYNPNTQELMNRQVQGNYDNFQLKVGLNNITWDGDLSNIQVSNYSRWL